MHRSGCWQCMRQQSAGISTHRTVKQSWCSGFLSCDVYPCLCQHLVVRRLLCGHAEEWRHLAGLHADKAGVFALVLGAVVLAPLTEEFFFRGYVLPSLTKWVNPLLAVSGAGCVHLWGVGKG